MKTDEKKHRITLTILLSVIVFFLLFTTMLIVSGTIMIVIKTNLFPEVIPNTQKAYIPVILIAVSSTLIGTLITALLGSIPLKPVNTLINKMNRLASGDFRVRIHLGPLFSKHPVIVELTDSFNKMAEELESTEMLRSDFINNFSHEFKTPIVSIAGFTKLLKKGNLTEEQKAEYLDIIEEESLRLSYMATNVLNLTRVENQTILTDISTYNLSEQLRRCILLLETKWKKKGLSFNLEFSEHMISANEELLKQVWINLVDNAIKFSAENAVIDLSIKEYTGYITVNIINSGSEISLESQKRIFNKFYQTDESHSSEGNGIGLAIVKKVVDLHNGKILVQSENDITMFSIDLPKIKQN